MLWVMTAEASRFTPVPLKEAGQLFSTFGFVWTTFFVKITLPLSLSRSLAVVPSSRYDLWLTIQIKLFSELLPVFQNSGHEALDPSSSGLIEEVVVLVGLPNGMSFMIMSTSLSAEPVTQRPVYPRKWAPAQTCTCTYYASVIWYGGKILQSNAPAKMYTNRTLANWLHFAHAVHFAHGGQNLLSRCDCRSDWFLRCCTRLFQIRIRGTKPGYQCLAHPSFSSCSLFNVSSFQRNVHDWPSNSQFMRITHRRRWCNLQNSSKQNYRYFTHVLSCALPSIP